MTQTSDIVLKFKYQISPWAFVNKEVFIFKSDSKSIYSICSLRSQKCKQM